MGGEKMPIRRRQFVVLLAAFVAAVYFASFSRCQAAPSGEVSQHRDSDRLVVHEWGTFTCLQDENGNAIPGINEDDEPVPRFVHRIATFLLLKPGAEIPILFQGAPQCHPSVTMRLETPVVYFHPPAGAKLPLSLDVEVAFKSGWLSEYYPAAEVEAPGVEGEMSFGPIRADTVGRLRWKNLQVGTHEKGPATPSPVWTTPRAVQSAAVTSNSGEHEQFLFYRGVGHVDSPLRISRSPSGLVLAIDANFDAATQKGQRPIKIPKLWLAEIREDKSCAFREIPGFDAPNDGKPKVVAATPASFRDTDFGADNVAKLSASMRSVLIKDGLFADEADALLNTWKLSYFESPGLRLFYLLPRSWTGRVLPMKLSRDAQIVRTMVGRVEIVSPEQRQLLQRIANGPASQPTWSRANQPMPPDFRAYEKLGRFRNALLLDEQKRQPTSELQKFISNYGLEGYPLPDPKPSHDSAAN
jgi:hypothetical protein